jgi:hypothetical protein
MPAFCAHGIGVGARARHPGTLDQSLGFVLQVDEVTDLLASFTSLSLQMQNMEKR